MSFDARSFVRGSRQSGAVIVTVALMLLLLLGFMGIALDFGRLFVVRTELQNAVDSCALAAANELDGASDSFARARNAGIAAGNLNRVEFQSASWQQRGQLEAADVSFLDATYTATSDPALGRYAACQHRQSGIPTWLLHIMQTAGADPAAASAPLDVFARAVATRASAQTTCPVPLALHPRTGGFAPHYGYTRGEWITLLTGPGSGTGGEIGWANLDGSNSAAQARAQMESAYCGVRVGDNLGSPGVMSAINDVWNARFGLYSGSNRPSTMRPDFTGYAYTTVNWPAGRNAYDGPSPGGGAQNYVTQRAAFARCGTSVANCEAVTGLRFNSFNYLASSAELQEYGHSRRIVTVPIVNGGRSVIDYGCLLMLQPLSQPAASSVQLEFLGNASDPDSPCTTNGIPGGVAGPLVPVLVE